MLLKQLPDDGIAMFFVKGVTLAPVTAMGFEALGTLKGFSAINDFLSGV
jgi:hypothetical protein